MIMALASVLSVLGIVAALIGMLFETHEDKVKPTTTLTHGRKFR